MSPEAKAEHATLTKERDTLRATLKRATKTRRAVDDAVNCPEDGEPILESLFDVQLEAVTDERTAHASLELWSREHGERWATLNEAMVLEDRVG